MSEMVMRVARAISEADFDCAGNYRKLAWAAIWAMRDPTETMLNAGPPEPYMDRETWAKMIDEALK